METKMVICTQKHRAVLTDIGATTFYDSYRHENTEADMQAYIANTYTIEKLAQNLSNPNIVYFLAYNHWGDVGYIKLLLNQTYEKLQGTSAEIEKIYVRLAFHGKGIAQQLMQFAIDYCKQLSYNNLYLGVWQENHKALKFYGKVGFKTFDTRTFQLGERLCDDYLLNLEL
jgi:GNAT superfamily N-acetyltransferase